MKNIGVVGYGVVGKSVVRFLKKHHNFGAKRVVLFDERTLSPDERAFLESQEIIIPHKAVTFEQFAWQCDAIIPSPGFKVPHSFKKRCITELDFFCQHYKKKIIGVTGTIGKTTIVSLAQKLLSFDGEHFLAAGNIGMPMLDACFQDEQSDGVVLELSSFQLEHVKEARCDIAVITNCFPNHLDRHGSFEEYFKVKLNLVRMVSEEGTVIISEELFYHDRFQDFWREKRLEGLAPNIVLIAEQVTNTFVPENFSGSIVTIENDSVVIQIWHDGVLRDQTNIVAYHDLPETTFTKNWLFVIALLHERGLQPSDIKGRLINFVDYGLGEHHQHRLELCHSYQGVDVYNDSKSTVIQSTQAAVDQLLKKERCIHLILGGLDKGADRSPLVEFIAERSDLLHVYYFGDAQVLFDQAGYEYEKSLEAVVAAVIKKANPGDQILFSPSGASFDFFVDYKERGKRFVELVKTLAL